MIKKKQLEPLQKKRENPIVQNYYHKFQFQFLRILYWETLFDDF